MGAPTAKVKVVTMAERTSVRSPWIALPRLDHTARLRLFCLPYAGGGAGIFQGWSTGLPADIEVCPVQLPGREIRMMEPAFRHIDPLVDTLVPALLPYLDRPYAMFGHSMGALIAFEVARRLTGRHGLPPRWLFVSGHRAPQLPDPDPPIHHLPDEQFIAELRRLKGTPEEILQHAELMQLLLPRLRADLALAETYTYRADAPLACPISAFGGSRDSEVSLAELEAWHEQTTDRFRSRLIPGDHFFLQSGRATLWADIGEQLGST